MILKPWNHVFTFTESCNSTDYVETFRNELTKRKKCGITTEKEIEL